jgi:hypothetical protein
MKGNPLTDQLVAFAGRLQENIFGQHHDLSLTGDNQARTFQTLAMRSMIFASSSFAISAERMVDFLNLRGTGHEGSLPVLALACCSLLTRTLSEWRQPNPHGRN